MLPAMRPFSSTCRSMFSSRDVCDTDHGFVSLLLCSSTFPDERLYRAGVRESKKHSARASKASADRLGHVPPQPPERISGKKKVQLPRELFPFILCAFSARQQRPSSSCLRPPRP